MIKCIILLSVLISSSSKVVIRQEKIFIRISSPADMEYIRIGRYMIMVDLQKDIKESLLLKHIIQGFKKLKKKIRMHHIIIMIFFFIMIIFTFVYRGIWIKGEEKHVIKDVTGIPYFLLPKEKEIIAEYSSDGYYLYFIADGRVFLEKNKKSMGLLYLKDNKERFIWKYAENITYIGKYSYNTSCQLNEDKNHFNDTGYRYYIWEPNPPKPALEGVIVPKELPLEGEECNFSYSLDSKYNIPNCLIWYENDHWVTGITQQDQNPYCLSFWETTRNSWFFEKYAEYIEKQGKL